MDADLYRYMYDVVVKKFTFAISSPDEFLLSYIGVCLWMYMQSFCLNVQSDTSYYYFITFRVRRSRGEMYIGHARLYVCLCVCICLSVCPSPHSHTNARTRI